jgi:phosphoglycolate phosphatase/pyrophosphatase PpaX
LKQFKLSHFFENIETGVSGGPRKAAGIRAILDLLPAIEKDEIIYVGDAPSDILASREAGISIVAAAWAATAEPDKLKALNPTELFYSIADFTNWLYAKI